MTASICAATGWTWDHVEETVTTTRLKALQRTWKKTLPASAGITRICMWLGVFEPEQEGSDLAELAAMAGPGGSIR